MAPRFRIQNPRGNDHKMPGMAQRIRIHHHDFIGGGIVSKAFPFHIHRQKHRSFGDHSHDAYEFFLVLRGSGVHVLNGKREKIQEGDLVFINLSRVHAFEIPDGVDLEIINVLFLPDIFGGKTAGTSSLRWKKSFLEPFFLPRHRLHLETGARQKILWLLGEILGEYGAKQRNHERAIAALMTYFFELVMRHYLGETKAKESTSPQFQAIQGWVGEHFSAPITLRELSARFRLSIPYISAAFKKNFGLSFKTFLTLKRLEHAKFLLRTGRTPITQIALDSGYENLSSFERSFRKTVGVSPSRFRSG